MLSHSRVKNWGMSKALKVKFLSKFKW